MDKLDLGHYGPGTLGLGHSGPGTLGLGHYEHGTLGLGHCGLGTLWAWYTVGLVHDETRTHGTTPNNSMKLSIKRRGAKKASLFTQNITHRHLL